MRILFLVYAVLIFSSGCRKEYPNVNEGPNPNGNISAISIISPLDSDEYQYGEEVLIKWQPGNAIVNIELFRKTEFNFEIASNINNNGQYIWVVPDDIPASVHYRIKIILKDNPDNSVFSDEFTIKGY